MLTVVMLKSVVENFHGYQPGEIYEIPRNKAIDWQTWGWARVLETKESRQSRKE